MGKGSAIDLPDPLEHADGPDDSPDAASGGVDDLLAQMAGEEIDRLLADADASRETSALSPTVEKPAPAAPQPPPQRQSTPVARAPAAPAVPPTPAATDLDLGTTFAERSALDLPDPAAPSEPATSSVDASVFEDMAADAPEDESGETSVPIYLKPLEWLNAPLAALPEQVRDLVGKVALLTFFNAAAVLLYVLIFRRRH
jgi:hypothetical protein